MPDESGRRFDQEIRDYHHALRRIQRRRSRSIMCWVIVPCFVIAIIVLAVSSVW
jgi:t-SNARE complex subunit (syntaxin)